MFRNQESGSDEPKTRPRKIPKSNPNLEERFDISDEIAASAIEEGEKIPAVNYKESKADNWIKARLHWENLKDISWQNGEFLKNYVNEMLLVWSQDTNSLEEARTAFRMEDFAGGNGELFIKTSIDRNSYHFDFNVVRHDGTSKKYSINFPRRKDIVGIGGDVEFYLKQIADKESAYAQKKPWHVSQST